MLTAEAIQEIKRGEHKPETMEVEGFKYIVTTDAYKVRIVGPMMPACLQCQSLSGLIAYLKTADPARELWEGDEKYLINILGHDLVKVVSGLEPKHMARREFIKASARENTFRTNSFMGIEEFIISMMGCFVQDDNTRAILSFVSSVQALHQSNQDDDGASQTVTVKKSITSVGAAKVPNPVSLRPYCSFPEITQPLREYVFRIRQLEPKQPIQCGLFTIDSDYWKVQAADSVREYLQEQIVLKGLPAVIIS